jgi:hypothetical protein
MVLLGILLYGCLELGIGGYLLNRYTIPMLGGTLDTLLSTMPLLDIILGCVGIVVGPILVFRGIVIIVTLLTAIWEESRW